MAEVTLDHVVKVYPEGTVAVRDLSLEIPDGELTVFVGPSGCGKTSALRMVAGLEEITAGEIRIGTRVVNSIPPRERDVAMIFQNYALYPHKTVYENLAFPLKLRKLPKGEVEQRVRSVARLLGLEEQLPRRPRQLSGGQRQRVAMGRALVREPQLFLMDEPLSNLDAKLRTQMRVEIGLLQKELGVTTIFVTHDQVEAMTLGQRIAVMRGGELQQVASPQELYDRPANIFVAGFIGNPAMNFLGGELLAVDGGLAVAIGEQRLRVDDEERRTRPGLEAFVDRKVIVGIRPDHVEDAALAPETPSDRRLRGQVRLREALGAEVIVHFHIGAPTVISEDLRELAQELDEESEDARDQERLMRHSALIGRFGVATGVQADAAVEVAIGRNALHFFDPETGQAIGNGPEAT